MQGNDNDLNVIIRMLGLGKDRLISALQWIIVILRTLSVRLPNTGTVSCSFALHYY